jgi:hypothetical protein
VTISLSDHETRRLRIRAQRLAPRDSARASEVPGAASDDGDSGARRAGEVLAAIEAVVGVQAQDASAARLAVRVRTPGAALRASDVERARTEARTIVRTWVMRGTLHLLSAADLSWIRPLLGPHFVRGRASRYAQLGLDADTYSRGLSILRAVLAGGRNATRAELADALASDGLRIEGQGLPHLVGRAALEGVVVYGPDKGGEQTFVLADDWLGPAPALARESALAKLAARYLHAFGPARVEDFASWSGLPMREAREGWRLAVADERLDLSEVEVGGRPHWLPRSRLPWLDDPPRLPIVSLLPAFDTYLLGYQGRELALAPDYVDRFTVGGGIISPAVLVDGRVVGAWRAKRRSKQIEVAIETYEELSPDVSEALADEVADVGRFLDADATWHVSPPA